MNFLAVAPSFDRHSW